ncbi:DUF871 domain-containing protein [Fundicoccus culcitae]|uniref:MupG family TIM beta-alpha barrel fold protein n=1 Tax=Fundicoccus culcitae TaxID=2969821 RepID=A0ABY5P8E3_9LACT|nr:MupG family TIM beta-alpha barrel fold protein [Fundicoccus culcitae]UUX35019.1 MupG family TIM beta-alpha barrel fold protein [Fundicoccus culcitae]
MRKLGISLYPEQSTFEADKAYLERAKVLGYERLFLAMHPDEPKDRTTQAYQQFLDSLQYAKYLGYEVGIELNQQALDDLGLNYANLDSIKEMGADIVRLDNESIASEAAQMTLNQLDLCIELNMSQGTQHVDAIMSYSPNNTQLLGSHNFYPQRYSGLGLDYFNACNQLFKKHGLRTMAFVNSQIATFGPWGTAPDGLCTLEMHRPMHLASQVKHLKLMKDIDDIVIANAYASEAELQAAAEAFYSANVALRVEISEAASTIEREMILKNIHSYRGDHSEYMIRSTWLRELYQHTPIPPHNNRAIKAGDVIINNDNYLRYKGELQIALKDMPADNRVNVVGRVTSDDQSLLDSLPPWSTFQLIE